MFQEMTSQEEVMRQIYSLHAKALQAHISRRLDGDQHLAEDLVQETFLRASTSLDLERVDVAELRPWLITVARRLIIDAYRKKAARPAEQSLELAANDVACSDHSDHISETIVLNKALSYLTPVHKRALYESYFCGRSSLEAAASIGISSGTVRSRVFYALRSLKEVLVSMDYPEATSS